MVFVERYGSEVLWWGPSSWGLGNVFPWTSRCVAEPKQRYRALLLDPRCVAARPLVADHSVRTPIECGQDGIAAWGVGRACRALIPLARRDKANRR